jgi:hypothetical protein
VAPDDAADERRTATAARAAARRAARSVPSPAAQPVAAPSPAPPPGACSGPDWEQRRGLAALASLRGGAERTGFGVEFRSGRSGLLGLTHLDQRRIEVFVRSCDAQSEELLRHVLGHELGHAYDATHMTGDSRAAWLRTRGIPAGTPWYGCSGCTDFATPAGDFAETYAQWARQADTNQSRLAATPDPAELAQLARTFFGA